MANSFDAYYKWFGIRPEEQPPDCYRLLGIRQFETDLDVISNAADQRMNHLRSLQTGPHAVESQRILNEVSKARVTLLDADRKLAYDVALRKKIAAAASRAACAPSIRADERLPSIESLGDLAREDDLDLDDLDLDDRALDAAIERSAGRPLAGAASGTPRGRTLAGPAIKFASVACGAALGLAVVYALVAKLADVDPLGAFSPRDEIAQGGDGADASGDGISAAANGTGVAEQGKRQHPAAEPSREHYPAGDPSDAPSSDRPRQTDKRPIAQDATGAKPKSHPPGNAATDSNDPFTGLPAHVALPELANTDPHVLLHFAGSPSRLAELALATDAAALEAGASLAVVAAGSDDARRWHVEWRRAASDASLPARAPLAELHLDGESLAFAWMPSAASAADAEQLRNCLLKLRGGGREAVVCLRSPVARPPHVLDFGTAASLVELSCDPLPRLSSLMLEIGPAEALPLDAEFKDERSRVRFATPTKEKIVVMLSAITDADRPELAIEPQATRKGLQMRIVPRVVNPKGESPLSLPQIADARKKYSVLKIKIDRQWSELSAQAAAIEKQATELEREIGGSTQRAALQRELSRVRVQLRSVQAAFQKVDADKLEVDGALDALGAAETLIGELHKKGKLPYRVFALAGETEIDLIRAQE